MTEKKVEEKLEKTSQEEVQEEQEQVQEEIKTELREDLEDGQKVCEEMTEENHTEKLQKEIHELNQRLLRVAADFDNFRRRTRVEKEELIKYANSNLITDLLPVLDNFQIALVVKEPSEEVKKFLTGMEMIYRQLMHILNQAGLEPIKALGETFDPEKHDAVMQVEDTEARADSIIEEVRTGYLFKDKVLRPSMVKVAKN